MRRESHKKGKVIPPSVLFQENLVFYAPLGEGDLTDWMSGETGATSANAAVTWDANKGMYLLSFNSTLLGHDCTALRYTSAAMQANLAGIEQGCSVFMIIEDVSYSGRSYQYSRHLSCDTMKDVWERSPRMNVLIDGGRMGITSPATNVLKKVCLTLKDKRYITYVNGTRVKSANWTDALVAPVSLGICDKNGHATSTTSQYNASQMSFYAKDVRVYNRELTASEVAQL